MIILLAFVLGALLSLVSFVQVLYLESLRLRTREFPALTFFKEELEERLGYESERGALIFSLVKHTLMVLSGAALAAAATLTEKSAAAPGPAAMLSQLEAAAGAWALMLGAAYIVPRILYRRSGGGWVLPLVPLLKLIAICWLPLVRLLEFLESLFALAEPEHGESAADAEEKIEAFISAGEDEGLIEKEDSRLIQNVVAFGDKRVREVMTPRPSVIGVDVADTLENVRRISREHQFSRMPVFEGSLDRVVGFVHVRDIYEAAEEGGGIREIVRHIETVPETMPVARLLRELQERGEQIVCVADEYGRMAGLASMEDLMEEVFGEIRDEHEPQADAERQSDGSVIVSGSFDLDNLEEEFNFRPGPGVEATTAGGLASEWYGAVPRPGIVIERDGLRMEVLAADDFRVDRVKISAAPAAAAETSSTA